MAQVLSAFIVTHGHIHGRTSLTRLLPFYFFLFLLSVPVFLFHLELFPELHYTKVMANLRCSAAEESEDTLNAFTSPTSYEPNLLAFGELNDSSVPFSFMIPSTDQDVDDVTLGEMLTASRRGQVDYCVPGGISVSQSSSSVMFDGSGQPDEERMVDQSGKSGVTFNVISAQSNFSEDIQIEGMVDRSGKPDERDSSNAQIRTLLEEQRHTTIAEYRDKVGHHELQAAHAEEERRLLQGQLWRQKLEFREAHQQSLTEMEELRNFLLVFMTTHPFKFRDGVCSVRLSQGGCKIILHPAGLPTAPEEILRGTSAGRPQQRVHDGWRCGHTLAHSVLQCRHTRVSSSARRRTFVL